MLGGLVGFRWGVQEGVGADWWNEAILGFSGLFTWGGWFGIGVDGGLLGLQAQQFLECVAVVAVRAVDAALEAGEVIVIAEDCLCEPDLFHGVKGSFRTFFPELSLADAETAEEPLAINEGVDEHALFRSGGVEAVVVFGGDGLEIGGAFAADDLSLASMPDLSAFWEERVLPLGVLGPVDWRALRRLAWICLRVAMGGR